MKISRSRFEQIIAEELESYLKEMENTLPEKEDIKSESENMDENHCDEDK